MSLIKKSVRAILVSSTALLALVASQLLLNGAPLRAQSYLQSEDAATSGYFGIDSTGSRMLKRSDTKDYDVEVWDLTEKKLLASITGLSGVVNDANISPDGSKVVTAERTGVSACGMQAPASRSGCYAATATRSTTSASAPTAL
jgi:WD40 repeat protein